MRSNFYSILSNAVSRFICGMYIKFTWFQTKKRSQLSTHEGECSWTWDRTVSLEMRRRTADVSLEYVITLMFYPSSL